MTPETPTQEQEAKPKHEGKELTMGAVRTLVPQNFAEAERLASILAKSDIIPKEMMGKPANILVALMFGSEIGLTPAQALQNIMVVNGRPSLWGDAVMGKVEASGLVEAWKDIYDPKAEGGSVFFTIKRKGREPVCRKFSMEDAKRAGLDKKPGPWQQYTTRMLFHRARSWALRDVFPDVLKGIRYYEEERDVIDLQRQNDKTYSMPKSIDETPETAPVETEEPKTLGTAHPPEEKPPVAANEGESFWVESTAKTEVNDEPAYVIRVKGAAGAMLKVYTSDAKLYEQAKEVAGSKIAALRFVTEKKDGYLWVARWSVDAV